jgi:hypothetical protein
MRKFRVWRVGLVMGVCLSFWPAAFGQVNKPAESKTPTLAAQVAMSREKGLDWFTKTQAADGSWGKSYIIGITGMGCLAYLSASDEPFDGDRGKVLVKALQFLLNQQKDGLYPTEGDRVKSWIHSQGFASLALSEAYGRSRICKVKPDIDMKKMRDVVVKSIAAISKNQSDLGGWWYTPGNRRQAEGATTVCAVQALVSADNYGIEIDKKVLRNGFKYLKKSQNPDGGFDYMLGPGTQSMKGGTAADVATLALMRKFDYAVMINGYNFLQKFTASGMSAPHKPWYFPYYGHYYGAMGMHLVGQEFKGDKTFKKDTAAYIEATQKDLVAWQQEDGSWPNKGWIKVQEKKENNAYASTFATLALFISEGRLSIYNREWKRLD